MVKYAERVYGICGISWFLMDAFWFYKLYPMTILFGVITLISAIGGLVVYSLFTSYEKKTPNHNIALATFSWIMLNVCALSMELSESGLFKTTGTIFLVLGGVSLIDLIFTNGKFLDKFRRL